MARRGTDNRSLINQVFGTELAQESTDERDRDADDRERWLREYPCVTNSPQSPQSPSYGLTVFPGDLVSP
jgi:hypothetical protein